VRAILMVWLLASSSVFAANPGRVDKETLRAKVAEVLRQPRTSMRVFEEAEHAEALRALGAEAMPALATFLDDQELGLQAGLTMLALDEKVALPFVFAAVPRSNVNVEARAWDAVLRLSEAGESLPWARQAREASIRRLKLEPVIPAMLVLGVTGTKDDVALLQPFTTYRHASEEISGRIHHAALAALARLGSEPHLAQLVAELEAPVPTPMTIADGLRLQDLLRQAAYVRSPRLTPLVCRHLSDEAHRDGDVGVSPAREAAQALERIVKPRREHPTKAQWKEWCAGGPEPRE